MKPAGGCEDRLAGIEAPTMTVGAFTAREGYRTASLQFESLLPSGVPANDTVQADLYLPDTPGPHPGVVVLHGLFAMADARFERGLAASLAQHGYVAAFMDLPFHRRRTPKGFGNGALFIRADLSKTVANVRQAATDASALARWLSERPDVDPHRMAMVGVSIGGFIVHLVMGQNSRIRSGVTFVSGGDVAGLVWKSHAGVARAVRQRLKASGIDEAETARQLASVEPLAYANCNAPRSVLMVNGTDDLIVPRSSAESMARALKNSPQLWLPTDHFGLILFPDRLYRLTRDFLGSELNGQRFPSARLKEYAIPALKAGLFTGLQSRLTLGAGMEWPLLFSRRNRPQLMLDGLWTGAGLFTGLEYPLTSLLDAGIAWRWFKGSSRPSLYLSTTLAF